MAELLRALEHQVLEVVGETRGLGRVVLASYLHGDECLDSWFLVIDAQVHLQTVVKCVDSCLGRVSVHLLVFVLRTGREREQCDNNRYNTGFSHDSCDLFKFQQIYSIFPEFY